MTWRSAVVCAVGLVVGAVSCRSLVGVDVTYDEDDGSGGVGAGSVGGSGAAFPGGAGGIGANGMGANGMGATGTGATGTGATGTGATGGGPNCELFRDEFDGAVLGDCWTNDAASAVVSGGELVVEPQSMPGEQWWDGNQGAFVHLVRDANFLVVTELSIEAINNGPVASQWNFAGLVARDMNDNWIKLEVGVSGSAFTPPVGTFPTTPTPGFLLASSNGVFASHADFLPQSNQSNVWLAMCRTNDQMGFFSSIDSLTWSTLAPGMETNLVELSGSLDVGPAASGFSSYDIRARFELVEFLPLTMSGVQGCLATLQAGF